MKNCKKCAKKQIVTKNKSMKKCDKIKINVTRKIVTKPRFVAEKS